MWKQLLDKEQIIELTSLGLHMLDALTSHAEGDTPEEKGQFVAAKTTQEREKKTRSRGRVIKKTPLIAQHWLSGVLSVVAGRCYGAGTGLSLWSTQPVSLPLTITAIG